MGVVHRPVFETKNSEEGFTSMGANLKKYFV